MPGSVVTTSVFVGAAQLWPVHRSITAVCSPVWPPTATQKLTLTHEIWVGVVPARVFGPDGGAVSVLQF